MIFNKNAAFIALAVLISISANAKVKGKKQMTLVDRQVGFLANVSGDVKVDNKPVKSGDVVRLNAKIQTGDQGKLQVLIGDGMVALLGHNTTVNVEKYEVLGPQKSKNLKNKEQKNPQSATEFAQFELQRGSLRLLVKQDEKNPRQGKVRSGKDFAVVKHGEAYFTCDQACEKKSSAVLSIKK